MPYLLLDFKMEVHLALAPPDLESNRSTFLKGVVELPCLLGRRDRVSVHGRDHVTIFQTHPRKNAFGLYPVDDKPGRLSPLEAGPHAYRLHQLLVIGNRGINLFPIQVSYVPG